MRRNQNAEPRPIKRVWAQDVNVAVDVLHARLQAAKAARAAGDWTDADTQLAEGAGQRLRGPPTTPRCVASRRPVGSATGGGEPSSRRPTRTSTRLSR